MARLLYGGSGADVLLSDSNNDDIPEFASSTYTAWSTRTGSTQLTDLLNFSNQATSFVSPTSDGRILFYGPDAYTGTIWLRDESATSATRWAVLPSDIADRTAVTDHGGLTGLADDDHPQYINTVRGDARYIRLVNEKDTLDELTGVAVTSPQQDHGLFYDAASSQFLNGPTPPLPYAPDDYATLTNFVPIKFVNEGDPVPPGTAANTLIGYMAVVGSTWGYGTDLGNAGAATVTAQSIVLASAVPAGTLIVVGVAADAAGGTQATWTGTDTAGNTYAVATSHIQASTNQTAILYSRTTVPLAIGNSITVTASSSRAHLAIKAASVTGAMVAPLDKFVSNGVSVTQPTSFSVGPTANTVQADEIAFAAFGWASSGSTFTPTNGWANAGAPKNSTAGASQKSVALVYRVLTAVGAPVASGDVTVGSAFSAVEATFKKA
jgi:hypothetical protein